MTPEEQRIAIAETCGWKRGKTSEQSFGDHNKIIHNDCWIDPRGIEFRKLPDYLNNLNAMHEAEAIIPDEKYHKYVMILESMYLEITRGRTGMGAYCATAAQRAEAFLKTVGKWKD